ncbi:hypothetical protein EVAR_57872_1 [Eumeta japonica]|uniref:Uncharacterized protein n=1 Tax=Eumeta variegata TaxID=151549 RepID=A0A4C1ZEF6_EUMVA|nr:hypothetical protein EVAR_57872_1 [Eumeta japonica]
MGATREQVAAPGHSQPQSSHQYVANLLSRNRIFDRVKIEAMEGECSDRGRVGLRKGHRPPERSLTRGNGIATAVTSCLYFVSVVLTDRSGLVTCRGRVDHSMTPPHRLRNPIESSLHISIFIKYSY